MMFKVNNLHWCDAFDQDHDDSHESGSHHHHDNHGSPAYSHHDMTNGNMSVYCNAHGGIPTIGDDDDGLTRD